MPELLPLAVLAASAPCGPSYARTVPGPFRKRSRSARMFLHRVKITNLGQGGRPDVTPPRQAPQKAKKPQVYSPWVERVEGAGSLPQRVLPCWSKPDTPFSPTESK